MNMANVPENMALILDGDKLYIEDAQGVTHVTFGVGVGDPIEWSDTIVTATCAALSVTTALDYDSDDDALPVRTVLQRWYEHLGAWDSGFIPHDEPNMDTEIGYR